MQERSEAQLITNIGRQEIAALGAEMETAVKAIAEAHGLSAERTSGRYAGYEGTLTFKITAPATATAKADETLEAHGAKFEVGFEFSDGSHTYRVTGFEPRRHKYPVSTVSIHNGKQYKHTLAGVNARAG
jgi:hypothetical protein